jgi:GT2 family glycosyltransferase
MTTLFQGKLTGHIGNIVFGWAWCPSDPLRRVYVEILIDGQAVNCVTAQLYDADLRAKNKGTGYYAFAYMLPEHILKTAKLIQAKIANDDQYLHGKISLMDDEDSKKKVLPLDTMLYHDGGLSLHGWLRDPFAPSKIFTLECFHQGEMIVSVKTKIRQEQNGAFKIELPIFLADGATHEVEVKIDKDTHLPGSPLKVWTQPQGATTLLDSLYQATANKKDNALEKNYQLLTDLLQNYEQRLPRSLRLTDYAQWYANYEITNTPILREASNTFILIVVTHSDGNVTKTLNSLINQTHTNWLVWLETKVPTEFQHHPQIQLRPEKINLVTLFKDKTNLLSFIEVGDHLPNQALSQIIKVFETHDKTGIVYTDCDQDDSEGQRTNPWFKSAWDHDLFLSLNYIDHLCVVNASLIPQLPYDLRELPWRAVQSAIAQQHAIIHLPHVLYHRRFKIQLSNHEQKLHLQWCQRYLKTKEPQAIVSLHPQYLFLRKISRPLPKKQPLISLIIPTKNQAKLLKTCIESIEKKSTYPNYEIIIIDNQTTDDDALSLLTEFQTRGHQVISYDKNFNYSAINNLAVKEAKGEIIGLINNDIEVITPEWMEEMLSLLLRPNIGAVGAKLLWPNEMVQHGGVLLGVNNLAGHIGNNNRADDLGYQGLLQVTHQVGAVTAACLLTRKSDYLNLNGLDEKVFPVAFNDVDYCLKLSQNNLSCVWTPFACMIHTESISRGKDDTPEKAARAQMEMSHLRERWTDTLMNDRYYHPSFSLNSADAPFSALAIPPRKRSPRY